jgi:hypothetical protein
MPRMTRSVKVALIVAACLLLPYFAVRWTLYAVYTVRVNRELALLRAEGGSTRLADFSPKARAAREGRAIRLYKEDEFAYEYPKKTRENPVVKLDPHAPIDSSHAAMAAIVFEDWLGISSGSLSGSLSDGWQDRWLGYLEKHLEDNRAVLDRVKAAADSDGAFDVDWDKGHLVSLKHIRYLRDLSGLMRIEAVVKARKGDMPGALEDVRLMFRLRRLIDDDPLQYSKLNAVSSDMRAEIALRAVLLFGAPDRASVGRITAELADREERNRMTDMLLGETAFGIQFFGAMRRNPTALLRLNDMYGDVSSDESVRGSRPSATARLAAVLFRLAWIPPMDECEYLTAMRSLRAWSRQDLAASATTPPALPNAAGLSDLQHIVAADLAGGISRIRVLEADSDARIRMVPIVLALALYKAGTRAYPSSLDPLVPGYLPAIPVDPYDGQPLRYRQSGTAYRLYSVGEDKRDSGGVQYKDVLWESGN